ncbi:MAG TPA: HAD-IC family P-type ATPase [Candidatus Dormibacteraeota bacterium]|nr:HAD-IC family P-type ATPase [Candidatus Dormibacteraeota bacterium]
MFGASRGLTSAEVAARRAGGRSRVRSSLRRSVRKHLRSSLTERLVLLLLVVAVIYTLLGEFRDAGVIFAVVAVVAGMEAWTEWRASRAIASLTTLSAPRALVWRDHQLHEVPPDHLVEDDVILLSSGSRVPADARLIEADDLLVDESLVTGESQPVERRPGVGERAELKAGTHVLRGRGTAVVTAVGENSTLGRVAGLVQRADAQQTPLQRRMEELARGLLIVAVTVSVVIPLIGLLRGQDLRQMVLTALTLAFATVPEELPVLVVVVLGLGSVRLVRDGAIIRRLPAAETLGATTLICTDKTGTLTENRISLAEAVSASEVVQSRAGRAGQLDRVKQLARAASEPPPEDSRLADPLDLAVWQATEPIWPAPMVRFGFDGSRRLASGLVEVGGDLVLAVKGAPEAVLVRTAWWRSAADGFEPLGPDLRSQVAAAAAELTAGGARVLAVGSRAIEGAPRGGPSQLERELVFEGLLAFSDPLRPEVPEAVRQLTSAGVAVTMVTGDQPATAAAVARAAGVAGPTFIAAQTRGWSDAELAAHTARGCVVARARPEDKLRIVQAAAAAGQVVAVTGDGVNDAPALEAAAIGVAMGRTGSDIAREAADLVLADDSFATLARAAAEGRRLYENLRKAVRYYLAVKLALIVVSLVPALTGRPLPFDPVQIVVLELFMDLGASVAYVNQPSETDEMRRRPRDPRARLLDRRLVAGIVAGGLTLAVVAGGVYVAALGPLGTQGARTLALVCWLVGHATLGIVMAWERRQVGFRRLLANPAMLVWAGASTAFALALLLSAPLAALVHAGPVPPAAGAAAVLAGLLGPLWLEATKRPRAG